MSRYCANCGRKGGGGGGGDLKRCSGCQEVYYCDAIHQKADWKNHKPQCKFVKENPKSIWIQVEAGEGNGLGNKMTNHWFSTKDEGQAYILQQPGGFSMMNTGNPPLRSAFCEILGWKVEVYHSGRVAGGAARTPLNGAGVFLLCDIQSGLSPFQDLSGRIFVTGRNEKGESMTSDVLWGILNFIWDSMDYYPQGCAISVINRWRDRYLQGSWTPQGGNGGIDVYCLDPRRCRIGKMSEHCN
jgi:MYND finger